MFGVRRLIVSDKARPRGQRLIHWRYVVYQRLIGVVGMRSYRLWLWNRTIAYRELNRRAAAETQHLASVPPPASAAGLVTGGGECERLGTEGGADG